MNAPYTEGPLDAKVCLIGEAPGVEEVRAQRPFVGRAGRTLDRLLARAGLIRSECRIENVMQIRPPNNKIEAHIDLTKKTPVTTAIGREHMDALLERLKQCSANIFVPLGNVALYTLLGMKEITKRRGSLYLTEGGRKVMPTIHPSSALRQYNYQHLIAFDLARARKESEFPELCLPDRSLILSPTFEQVLEYIEECFLGTPIAFDIEVFGEEISHVSLGQSPTDGICIPFYDGGKDYFTPPQEAEVWLTLQKLLEDKDIIKLGQNIIFDASFVFARYGIIVEPMDDTMIAQAIRWPDFPKGLDFIVSIHCNGEPYYKDEGKRWYKNPFGTVENFRRYSAMDSVVLHEAFPKQIRELVQNGNLETYNQQKRLLAPLTYISSRGIRMDVEGMAKASVEASREIARLQQELNNMCGFELNVASPKQVKAYFYIQKGIKPLTKQGAITVDEKALQRLSGKGHKEAETILEIRGLRKAKGTYYDMELDKDNRLRCSWNPVGTEQGRVSSSKTIFGTGGNMQNQPEKMKRFMLADPGYIMVSVDKSQAENRVTAYVANERRMIRAFEAGEDVHKLTASLIFNKPIEEVSDEPGSCSIGGGRFSERFWGKKANHGLNYDLGYRTFALYYQISEKEAKFIVESYHRNYPGIRQWHAHIRNQLSSNRTLTNLLGRKRQFMGRWDDALFKKAYSFIPQSTVADTLNRSLCDIYENKKKTYFIDALAFDEVDLLNNVHDSILFQVPFDGSGKSIYRLLDTVQEIQDNFETVLEWEGREFIIPMDTKIGFNAKEGLEIKSGVLRYGSLVEMKKMIEEFANAKKPA